MNPNLLPYVVVAASIVGVFLYARHVRPLFVPRPWLIVGALLALVPLAYVGVTWLGLIGATYLRFERPWAVVVGMIAVLWIALRLPRQWGRPSRARAAASDSMAMATAFLASFAAASPEIGRPLDRLTILIAVDRSRSMELVADAEQRIASELAAAEVGMREDDRIGTVVFGATAVIEDPPRPKSDLPAPQRVEIGRDGTDIGAAIRRALAEVPPDSAARIALISDGVSTRGEAMGAAAAALAAQVPVDVVPLEQRRVNDIRVVSLRAPSRVDAGEAFDMRLVTSSPAPAEIEIRVKRDGKLLSKATAKIAEGEDVLHIREKIPEAGLFRYDVEVTAADPSLDVTVEDNTGATFVRVRGEALALVLEGDPGQSSFIASALRQSAFVVQEGGATAVPTDLGALAGFDLVVLSDIRASDLSPAQIDMLASYVRELGGGLLLMGGDRSLGPGGYARTPLEDVSPVSFDLKQDKRRASLAQVIGIDISGSMAAEVGGHTKLELANEAAVRASQLLGSGDHLGVEHVDTAVAWSVPLAEVTDLAAIEKAIRSVGPGGGGILVDITLEEAYAALDKAPVNIKHVLLFADGADAENMPASKGMAERAFARGITTSVISLGRGSDVADLEHLSTLAGGRFYLIEDATRLPTVFAQETILAARSAIVEEPFRVSVGAGSSVLSGIDFGAAPELQGYVVTIPKGRASVLLSGPESDPIVATWSVGIGRSAVFTSDLKDRWGAAWTTWPGAARLVAQLARDVARRAEDTRVRVEADTQGGQLRVVANVVGDDGRAESFRRLKAHVAGPDGFSRELPLEAVGAGSYAATLPLSRPGGYVVVARDEDGGDPVGTTGAVLTAGEELRPTGSDLALLARIASLSGGKKRDTLSGIFADRGARRFAYEAIAPTLVVLAALAMLLAVAARRLALPDALLRLPARIRNRRRDADGEPGSIRSAHRPAPARTVGVLLDARQRAREGEAGDPTLPARPMTPPTLPPTVVPRVIPARVAPAPGMLRRPPVAPPAGSSRDDAPPPSARPTTAAEILLARRKGQGR